MNIRKALTLLVGLALVLATASTSAATSYSSEWDSRARAAIDRFAAVDDGNLGPHAYAYVASAIGNTYGWDDPRVEQYLAKVRTYKQPDGGYGLTYRYDWMSDGSYNPVDTTYTVTVADHVGPVLLEAYKHGKATRTELQALGTVAIKLPVLSGTTNGYCYAYSDQWVDRTKGTFCVHNVNASVSLFLTHLQHEGIVIPDADWVTLNIDRRETNAYLASRGNWLYWDNQTSRMSDIDHTSLNVEWALEHSPQIGSAMLAKIMTNAFPLEADTAPLAHWRLTPWACDLGARWFGEFDSWLLPNPPGSSDGIRYAQMARWAARNADAC